MIPAYDPRHWYWCVGGDESRVWSSEARAYVAAADAIYQAWLSSGSLPTEIPNDVELNNVLAHQVPDLMMTRTFTPVEVMAALDHIDHGATATAFTAAEISAPTLDMAARLQALAADLGVSIGTIG